LPVVKINTDLDLPPSLQETIRAVQQLSSRKEPGSDAIPAEIYKHGGAQQMHRLTAIFQEMWHQGQVPQDFIDATVVHLYKKKGHHQPCDNHQGIPLLNIAGKIFARILINLTNGVKQGCVLVSTLFSLMFSAMLTEAYRDERPGIRITYHIDGRLFNQRQMHFRSRVSTATIPELLFADACALNATTEEERQRSIDLFAAACDNFGLRSNTEKTVVMHQSPSNTIYTAAHTKNNSTQLKSVDNFTYLGRNLSRSTKVDNEIALWIAKASQAFGRM
uniref:Reverse transcriptase domain-containing protein n=1 Tax=Schistocephalus solidus TaxID=70667 RepID=A0A183TDS6_SCHSO